ncbi:uncharacterized protein [Nicotiana sylvestris]|uniref:uncharacterized protein n=1 Tax=Nicotiana sylvestris TaxID=4096 RepID=UPI00388CD319
MGLNEAYGQARGIILMMKPLPNINHAYSLILQDENHKEVYANPLISTNASSFMVGNQNNFQNQGNFSQRNRKQRLPGQFQKPANGFQKSRNPPQRTSAPKARKGKFNPNVSCTYYKKIGHSIAYCYRIIGFPDGFEFTNGKQGQAPIRGNGAFLGDQGDDLNNNFNEVMNQHLSKEQFSQLVQLTKQVKVIDAGTSNSEINVNVVAGTIIKYSGSCFLVYNSSTWIIDLGALEHMCFDSIAFISLSPLPVPLDINLPNSFKITIIHVGKVSIHFDYIFENVLHVPTFRYNLMSVNRFYLQFHCIVSFYSTRCMLQAPLIKRAQIFGEAKEGLYLLEPNHNSSRHRCEENIVSSSKQNVFSQVSVYFPFSASTISDVNLWHVRLGHLPFSSVKHLNFISIPSDFECLCDICPKARQTRNSFPLS